MKAPCDDVTYRRMIGLPAGGYWTGCICAGFAISHHLVIPQQLMDLCRSGEFYWARQNRQVYVKAAGLVDRSTIGEN